MEPGDLIAGKYRLDQVIGEGAMGVVWRGTQLDLDRPVAIKVMNADVADRGDARARFVREARVAAALRHPCVVSVMDFGAAEDADGALYLVMELLVGQSLREHLETATPTLPEVATLAIDVASALVAAHQINLVHRDLKPENIFIERHDDAFRARVVDFGLAFIAPQPGAHQGSLGRMTEEGVLGGTPAYMSPEQTQGSALGPASDLYSLGCVIYELVTGRPPFSGSVAELLTRHAYAAPISMRTLAPDRVVDPQLDELVLALLAKAPALRPSAQRVIDVLAPIAEGKRVGRSRTNSTRAERMVRVDLAKTTPLDAVVPGVTTLAWIGVVDEALALELVAYGFVCQRESRGSEVVYAPGAALEMLASLVQGGHPVVTDVAPGDLVGITARLRSGVAEVVALPVRVDELARKLRRAMRRR